MASLESEGSELANPPLNFGEEPGNSGVVTEELTEGIGLKIKDHDAIKIDNKDEEVPQVVHEGQQSAQILESSKGTTMNVQEVGEA